jgi:hypothetical protein
MMETGFEVYYDEGVVAYIGWTSSWLAVEFILEVLTVDSDEVVCGDLL